MSNFVELGIKVDLSLVVKVVEDFDKLVDFVDQVEQVIDNLFDVSKGFEQVIKGVLCVEENVVCSVDKVVGVCECQVVVSWKVYDSVVGEIFIISQLEWVFFGNVVNIDDLICVESLFEWVCKVGLIMLQDEV